MPTASSSTAANTTANWSATTAWRDWYHQSHAQRSSHVCSTKTTSHDDFPVSRARICARNGDLCDRGGEPASKTSVILSEPKGSLPVDQSLPLHHCLRTFSREAEISNSGVMFP